MKIKYIYPIVALAAAVTIANVNAEPDVQKKLVQVQKSTEANVDYAAALIEAEIIAPLRKQERKRNTFSRSISFPQTYMVVETTSEGITHEREFSVVRYPQFTQSSLQFKQAKLLKAFLKLKFTLATKELQVESKGKWVALSEHPYLKLLPNK